MKLTIIITIVSFLAASFQYQTQYKVLLENVTLEYLDHKVMDYSIEVYQLNATDRALKSLIRIKVDFPDSMKFILKASKWIRDDYKLHFINIPTTFKAVTEMESFDLRSLWVEHTTPPIIWPLKKGVAYRTLGWVMDSSQFPPHVPEGKWRTTTTLQFPNKTDVFIFHWYSNIVYKKTN